MSSPLFRRGEWQIQTSPSAGAGDGSVVAVPVSPDPPLDPWVDASVSDGVDEFLEERARAFDSGPPVRQTQPSGGSPTMYGMEDIYSSPAASSGLEEAIDREIDGEFDRFGAILGIGKGGGILGIALTPKARENKISRIVGKLKKFYEEGNLDKARRYAKALKDPVKHLEKKGSYTPSPEVEVWLQFADDGNVEALTSALEKLDWTGDQEAELGAESGAKGTRARSGHRKLPPGYRPPQFARWGRAHKLSWLRRHPNAARAPSPDDPGSGGGGGGYAPRAPGGGSRRVAAPVGPPPVPFGHPERRVIGRPVYRPVPTVRPVTSVARPMAPSMLHPATVAARPASPSLFRPVAATPGVSVARPASSVASSPTMAPSLRGSGILRQQAQLAAARTAGRQFAKSRYGEEDPISQGISDAFGEDVDPISLGISDAFAGDPIEDYLDPSFSDPDDSGSDDEFGSILPRRTVAAQLEAARARYERLKARAVTDDDMAKVNQAYNEYKQLATAYRREATAPVLRSGERVLSEMQQDPYFDYQGPTSSDPNASWQGWSQGHTVEGASAAKSGGFKIQVPDDDED